MQRKIWSQDEITKLKQCYPICTTYELTIMFQCSARVLEKKSAELRLLKEQSFLKHIRKHHALSNIRKATTEESRTKKETGIREMIRKERLRIKYGLKQKTKRRFAPYEQPQRYAHWKHKLRRRGYITQRYSLDVFFDEDTKRSVAMEQHLTNKGFTFKNLNE